MKKIFCVLLLSCFTITGFVYAQNNKFEKAVEVNGGVGLDDRVEYTFGLNFVGGYRLNDMFLIGGGLGYSYINGLYYTSFGPGVYHDYDSYDIRNNLNLFARIKMNFTNTAISPFLSIDLGGTIGMSSNSTKMANGFLFEPAFGCDFSINEMQKLYLMIGYKGMQYQYHIFDYYDLDNYYNKGMAGVFCVQIGFTF